MLQHIKNLINDHKNLFITGGGGVGKSYILGKLREIYPNMIVTATTGISAINVEGQTIHSWAGVGICNCHPMEQLNKIKKSQKRINQIKDAKLLAIDEISMLDDFSFCYIDYVLRNIRKVDTPFGGIQVILIGDFFQLPPVQLENGKDFCFKTDLWNDLNLQNVLLTKVYRQNDTKLIDALNNIREGCITPEQIRLFANREVTDNDPHLNAVRLYSTKKEADIYNDYCYNALTTEEHIFKSKDFIKTKINDTAVTLPILFDNLKSEDSKIYNDFVDRTTFVTDLKLKVGARVMLLTNISIDDGLVNGACGTVAEFDEDGIYVNFDNCGKHLIEKTTTKYYYKGKLKITRKQYPLRLAYALTIHKSQGMTFQNVYLDLKRIFTFGHAYVGLSRVTSLNGLFLKNFNPGKIMANPEVIEFYKKIKAGLV